MYEYISLYVEYYICVCVCVCVCVCNGILFGQKKKEILPFATT